MKVRTTVNKPQVTVIRLSLTASAVNVGREDFDVVTYNGEDISKVMSLAGPDEFTFVTRHEQFERIDWLDPSPNLSNIDLEHQLRLWLSQKMLELGKKTVVGELL